VTPDSRRAADRRRWIAELIYDQHTPDALFSLIYVGLRDRWPNRSLGSRQQVLVAGEWASLGLDPRPLLTRPPHKPHFPSFGPSNGGPDGLVEMMIVVVLRIFCLRFGTEPRFLEDESVSAVRLSSRILSCGGAGGPGRRWC
jgi:hypothetical protein